MRLNPPKKNVFWLTFFLALVGVVLFLLGFFMTLPAFVGYLIPAALFLAWLLLWLGNMLKGF